MERLEKRLIFKREEKTPSSAKRPRMRDKKGGWK